MTNTDRGAAVARRPDELYRCSASDCSATFFAVTELERHARDEHGVLRDLLES